MKRQAIYLLNALEMLQTWEANGLPIAGYKLDKNTRTTQGLLQSWWTPLISEPTNWAFGDLVTEACYAFIIDHGEVDDDLADNVMNELCQLIGELLEGDYDEIVKSISPEHLQVGEATLSAVLLRLTFQPPAFWLQHYSLVKQTVKAIP